MHFALPPRKTSHPPPYARRSSRSPSFRRARLQQIALVVTGIVLVFLLISWLFSSADAVPPGTPRVVIVTPLDRDAFSPEYIEKIVRNRQHYADRHGYKAFFPNVHDYDLANAPRSWSRVPAIRHAMAIHPHSEFFFQLDQRALIMNQTLSIESHIMNPVRLESLMLKDVPVVPPDSVIMTFSHLRSDRVDLVLTQDDQGLGEGSMILRQGEWAKFFLDSWFDPLYRSYNFQNAEVHALEHLVQWHPTVLAKLALVPQRTMNAYNTDGIRHVDRSCLFEEGDFVIVFNGCTNGPTRNCEREMQPFFAIWDQRFFSSSASGSATL